MTTKALPTTTKATGPLNNANAPPVSNATTGIPPLKDTIGSHNLPVSKDGSSVLTSGTKSPSTHNNKGSGTEMTTTGSPGNGNGNGINNNNNKSPSAQGSSNNNNEDGAKG